MRNLFGIRLITPDDAEGVLRAHYSAVHETARSDYPETILNAWSRPIDAQRIADYRSKLQTRADIISYVAVNDSGSVLGFGELVLPDTLGAIYVAASAGRRGVASALLRTIESKGRELGMTMLSMDSSLTAVPFYVRHGFREVKRGSHRLGGGLLMECVGMEKKL